MDDTMLTFEPAAIASIAKVATKKKVGARALRAILEEIMLPIMYEASDKNNRIVVKESDVDYYIEHHLSQKIQALLKADVSA